MKHPCDGCRYRDECFEPCDKLMEYMELGPDPDMYDDRPILQQYVPR